MRRTSRSRRFVGHGAGTLVGLVLAVAVGWVAARAIAGTVVRPLLFWWETAGWERVPCEIVRARARTRGSGLAAIAVLEVSYAYERGGRRRTARRFHPVAISPFAEAADAAARAKRLRAGSRRACYVDPADAGRAVLTRAAGAVTWGRFLVISGVAVLIGVAAPVGLAWMAVTNAAGLLRLWREGSERNAWKRRAAALRAEGIPVNHDTMHDPDQPVDEPVPGEEARGVSG